MDSRYRHLIPEEYDAVLADMDGVMIYGESAAPGAAELIRRAGDRLYLVTNESGLTADGLSLALARRGLEIPPERIVLAGALAVDRLRRERPDARVLLRGAGPLHELARRAGLRLSKSGEPADVVLLGRDPFFDVPALETLTRAIEDGAELWATNPDRRHPVGGGRHSYQTGALLAALLACVGDVPVTVVGKPQPDLFLEALARSGVSAERSIMIGDNPMTDGAGAAAASVPVVIVGPEPDAVASGLEALIGKSA